MKSRDATVIRLKMGFVVSDHFMALQRSNQPLKIKSAMWIQKVLEEFFVKLNFLAAKTQLNKS